MCDKVVVVIIRTSLLWSSFLVFCCLSFCVEERMFDKGVIGVVIPGCGCFSVGEFEIVLV